MEYTELDKLARIRFYTLNCHKSVRLMGYMIKIKDSLLFYKDHKIVIKLPQKNVLSIGILIFVVDIKYAEI